jgi:chaperonin GroES
MKIKPIYNRLVVKRDAPIKQTASGLLIVEAETNDRNQLKPEGLVMEVGHDVRDVVKGYHILFRKMSGTEVKLDGEDLLVMTEDDVIAVLA